MKMICTESYEESARIAAGIITGAVNAKPDLLLGLATGETAEGIYAEIVKTYEAGGVDFSRARSVNLDEYIGCDEPDSYRYFMGKHLFNHINIPPENITIADYTADPEKDVGRMSRFFEQNRVDLQLLGIGANGHIGFNEPAGALSVNTHIENLTESTIEANARLFANAGLVPRQAITMGMGDIMKARRILLAVKGESKRRVLGELLDGETVSPQNPASLLLLHPDVTVIFEK